MSRAGRLAAVALAAVVATAPTALRAQERVSALADACGAGGSQMRMSCLEVALAARAIQGATGLAATPGSSLPGSVSTLGKRIAGSPRLGLAARAGFVSFDVPDVLDDASTPASGESVLSPVLQGTVGLGLFDGFSPQPTVGGVLSVDLLAMGTLVLHSGGDGFDGSTGGFGLGARLGIVRESFTLPGITLSAARHWMGEVAFGGPGERAAVVLDPSVTSFRLAAGKDLLAVGVSAGLGWDRYGGDVRIEATNPLSSLSRGSASADDFEHDRMTAFGGVTYTFLVLQVAAEGGWAWGFDAPPERASGGFDAEDGHLFASLALRLIY